MKMECNFWEIELGTPHSGVEEIGLETPHSGVEDGESSIDFCFYETVFVSYI